MAGEHSGLGCVLLAASLSARSEQSKSVRSRLGCWEHTRAQARAAPRLPPAPGSHCGPLSRCWSPAHLPWCARPCGECLAVGWRPLQSQPGPVGQGLQLPAGAAFPCFLRARELQSFHCMSLGSGAARVLLLGEVLSCLSICSHYCSVIRGRPGTQQGKARVQQAVRHGVGPSTASPWCVHSPWALE